MGLLRVRVGVRVRVRVRVLRVHGVRRVGGAGARVRVSSTAP